ncbi:TPA: hypothetical protein QDZ88_002239 [Stenotrophomonas maltophilia]|nr:hypothetical protein [Stenotrophomonas maltophilia]
MDWWLGFNQCWPMGEECTIDWDAWAVVAALFTIYIAWLSALVTALSAAAVFWLGKQANSVASASHRIATASHEIAQAERSREAHIILAYLYSEVLDTYSSIEAWLQQANAVEAQFLGMNDTARRQVLDGLGPLAMPQTEAILGRLHVVDEEVGSRLARALGTLKILRLARDPMFRLQNDNEGRVRVSAIIRYARSLRDDLRVVNEAGVEANRPVA